MITVDGGDESPAPRSPAWRQGRLEGVYLPTVALAAGTAAIVSVATEVPVAVRLGVTVVALTSTITWLRVSGARWRTAQAELWMLRDQEQRFRMLVQNSYDVVTVNDVHGTITYMSGGSQRMFGREPSRRRGGNILELIHPDDQVRVAEVFKSVTDLPESSRLVQMRFPHSDGSWRWVEVLVSNLLHEPSVRGIVCNTRDITETRELQERLEHAATHDALTGLPNRVLLVERLTAELDTGVTVVLADLNEFKLINDTFGHAVGDELLVTVADRMRRALRPQDTAGRLGGDEFALVLAGNDRIATDAVLDRLVRALDEPVTVSGLSLSVRASLGVALSQHNDDINDLIRRADLAMYDAKREGLNRWRYHEAEPAVPARRA